MVVQGCPHIICVQICPINHPELTLLWMLFATGKKLPNYVLPKQIGQVGVTSYFATDSTTEQKYQNYFNIQALCNLITLKGFP